MTSDPENPSDPLASLDAATREALMWIGHLNSGEETEQDRRDYEFWKAADPEHARAARRAEEFWQMLGPALAGASLGRPRGKTPGRLPIVIFAILALGGLSFGAGLFGPPAAYFADERTGVGERRSIVLADGSRVELDTRTSLDIGTGGRMLALHGGQIFVTAARDPGRPFRVQSGEGFIEALGTAFGVRLDDATTTVVVTESRVRVSSGDPGRPPSSVEIRAGEGAGYTTGMRPTSPSPADLRERTAWRDGELSFDDRPLGEVMAELGRYQRGVVVFMDGDLQLLPVTGVFKVDNIDGILEAVARVTPVKIRRLPWLTLIQRDPDRPPIRGPR